MLEALVSFFIELDEDKVIITIQRLIKAGIEKKKVVEALNKALDIIGKKYETGEYTLSDLMMAGILYEQIMEMDCIDISKSIEKTALKNGMIVIGTIESDMHDIGKSLFKSVASTSGFKVVDLGVNVKPEIFCQKIKELNPDIVGISAVLTGAISHLRKAIDAITQEGLRDQVKIIIGGSVVDAAVCKEVGADGFTDDAIQGVEICQKWMNSDG
ncbi:B12-binding domain-containing protein [Eubacterium limosum]|uniref:cobalamin B12-binding domain-containing protein n=1 Tax=Eubacterium limosum TaxID=1736 RepID=UPI00372000B1